MIILKYLSQNIFLLLINIGWQMAFVQNYFSCIMNSDIIYIYILIYNWIITIYYIHYTYLLYNRVLSNFPPFCFFSVILKITFKINFTFNSSKYKLGSNFLPETTHTYLIMDTYNLYSIQYTHYEILI